MGIENPNDPANSRAADSGFYSGIADSNPYASLSGDGLESRRPEDDSLADASLAGRIPRFAAAMLDMAIAGGLCFVALVMIFMVEDLAGLDLRAVFDPIASASFLIIIAATHVPLLASGTSIGKRILGLRITRTNGDAASLPRLLFLRHGLHIVGLLILLSFLAYENSLDEPLFGLLLLVPFALPLGWLLVFRRDRRTLYDLMADTRVVRDDRIQKK